MWRISTLFLIAYSKHEAWRISTLFLIAYSKHEAWRISTLFLIAYSKHEVWRISTLFLQTVVLSGWRNRVDYIYVVREPHI